MCCYEAERRCELTWSEVLPRIGVKCGAAEKRNGVSCADAEGRFGMAWSALMPRVDLRWREAEVWLAMW